MFGPKLFPLVSIYMKFSPMGGRLVTLVFPVELFVLVEFILFCIFPVLVLLLHYIFYFLKR